MIPEELTWECLTALIKTNVTRRLQNKENLYENVSGEIRNSLVVVFSLLLVLESFGLKAKITKNIYNQGWFLRIEDGVFIKPGCKTLTNHNIIIFL